LSATPVRNTRKRECLRHLFAVRLTRGVPITVVSELVDHSDINLTVKRYGTEGFSSDARVKWEAVRVLDAA
jgi:hypothetical protein